MTRYYKAQLGAVPETQASPSTSASLSAYSLLSHQLLNSIDARFPSYTRIHTDSWSSISSHLSMLYLNCYNTLSVPLSRSPQTMTCRFPNTQFWTHGGLYFHSKWKLTCFYLFKHCFSFCRSLPPSGPAAYPAQSDWWTPSGSLLSWWIHHSVRGTDCDDYNQSWSHRSPRLHSSHSQCCGSDRFHFSAATN